MTRFELFRKNLWLIVRRAPRDRRAAYAVLLMVGFLAWLAFEAFDFWYLGVWGSLCSLGLLAIGGGAAWLIGRSNARVYQGMIKLSTAPSPEPDPDYSVHRRAIAAAAFRKTVLVDRAAAEMLHRNGKVSAERAGLLRRRSLDIARAENRWDWFTQYERELLMSQEGSWDW